MPRCGLAVIGGRGGEPGEAGGLGKRARGRDWLLIAASPGSCRSIIRFHRAGHWDSFGELCRDGRPRHAGVGLLRPGKDAGGLGMGWDLGLGVWVWVWVRVRVHRMGLYFG